MNTNHTVESMLKELKANLTRYENLLEKYRTLQISKGKVGGTE